ncbi:MAG: ribosome maturation factor RimP [Deltaproteobacteria bacterium]|nr:ribosome maturation factor RimP [Deltaproteobacteria bacterium]
MLVTPDILRRLRDTIDPVVDRLGYELVAVELTGGADSRTVLRISIDHAGGVGIEDCGKVARELSPALDVDDPIVEAYNLEVSTPGIERPVQKLADFQRFAGCEVRIKPFGVEGRRRVKGTLLGADGGVVRVRVDKDERLFPVESIERANLALTFDQFQRLGKGLPPNETEST